MNGPLFLARFAVLVVGCMALGGCSQPTAQSPRNLPPTITVSYPLHREVTDYEEYPGRTAAIDSVLVRARVSGYLQAINFADGAEVKQGDVLYEIDPRPYQAALDQAKAQVKLQEAQLKYNEAVYNRNLRLQRAGQAVDIETVQQSLAQRDTTQAQLTAAKAAVEQADLNLNWTKVTAPISGRLSRTLITRGNLIVADQTLLTTLVALDPIYAYFDVDEQTVLRVQKLIREGRVQSVRAGAKIPVYLGLATETGHPHEGLVDFVNNQVTASTGTLELRGVFQNPKPAMGDRVLSPGLFVRIRVPVGPPYQAILIAQRALGTDQDLKFVYVLDEQNQVVRRDVKLGTQQEGLQVITEGLKASERVVVNGVQKVRSGLVVSPKLVPMPVPAAEEQQSALVVTAPAARKK
jgi:RND family efflux transporter MFP subunit